MADNLPTLPSPPSEKEAMFYYSGLPSGPRLVARTGTTPWKEPTGPEAYRKLKELGPVGNHPLCEVWGDGLALKVHDLLDTMKVKWTSIDVVRIKDVEESFAPVILWIGVLPASLSGEDGVVVASKCRELLVESGITDVDVEIRESVVTRWAAPKFPTSTYSFDSTVDVREPLTTTLGLPICAQSTPCADGTGGFFIAEGVNTKRLLLVTARHVIFPPDKNENKHFEHKNDSQPRHNVTLFGDAAFNKYLESIKAEIGGKVADKDVSTHWATPESRVLGHVILSPPINVGIDSSGEGYTEDWAVIEIDASKVDASNFDGNAIDLGTRIPVYEFARMMHPNPRNAPSFEYPGDRLLRLKGTIPDEEMRHPTALDQNDEPCLVVIKRGITTGLTVGHANNICSYARNYDNDNAKISKEWAILPQDCKSGAFADKGDSGSVIVDALGRIGGLLTSGAGATPSADVTYATPISFLLKRMQDNALHIDAV
ncbi:uncharacterized protein LAESUDRAFT_298724 [Laetiporus sulphureus 93-53]|uniref:Trypsin-like serine protease n=1 Tax=Laetiporus sulphureus 93-53 TaxID=1314785 RepID=A0A165DBW3_9APHY|nr:uncharacterized protein LAESUDRAFT_298724 [Laetiporus sulphureus 93-53]KZT04518.1 hypothetical protein LAESUDRAFT_298724 [Laetiporus sulphureus 93-53]